MKVVEPDLGDVEKIFGAIGLTFESHMRLAMRDQADVAEEMARSVDATLATMGSSAFEKVGEIEQALFDLGVEQYIRMTREESAKSGEKKGPVAQKYAAAREQVVREQWDDRDSDFWRCLRNEMLALVKLSNEGKDRRGLATKLQFLLSDHIKLFKSLFKSTIVDECAKVLPDDAQKPEPAEVKIVAIEESVKEALGKEVAKAVKNKGGRPRKKGRAADYMTQKEVAVMFNAACGGEVCNESKVSNWESFARTEGRRGSTPPEGMYGGRAVVYTADLREHPTPENKAILAAIIERFRSTRAVKDGIKNAQKIRYKSEESLHRMRGGMQAELARRRKNL